MKATINLTTGLALATLFAGCVVTSVYPFYTAKDVVFDPALVGIWAPDNSTNADSEHWKFEKSEGQAYKLTVKDKDEQTEYDTYLFKLKDRLFLDLCPRERPDNTLPLHYLLSVSLSESTFEMSMLNYDWLKNLIKEDPKAIRHIVVPKKVGESGEGDLVVTADTTELQAFILKHVDTEGAFGDPASMKRWPQ